MNHNRDINNAALEESDYSNVQSVDELTKSEEHYCFVYHQVQVGFPFSSAIWLWLTRSEGTENSIDANVWGKWKIEFLSDGLFSQGEPLEERRVHYPFLQEAVNADLEEYIQAIMEDPAVILLDEPMNGLDNQGVEDIRKVLLSLRDKGKTILLASHSKEDIAVLCDTVTEMEAGHAKRVDRK